MIEELKMKNLLLQLALSMTIATTTISAQGVVDVHSHIITPELVSSLERVLTIRERHLSLSHKDVYVIPVNELCHLPSVTLRVNQIASVSLFLFVFQNNGSGWLFSVSL